MGLFKRNTGVVTTPVPEAAPANRGSLAERARVSSGAMVDRASKIYKDNPKTVGGIALIASALLLNRMRSRGLR
jgi:hypothetical protein